MPTFTAEPIKISLGLQGSIGILGSLINPTIRLRRPLCSHRSSRIGNLLLKIFLDDGIGPYNGFALDHVVGTKIGSTIYDSNGQRHNAADLLTYANPSNIKVTVYVTVERLLVVSSRAIGVVFRDKLGLFHHVMLKERGRSYVFCRSHW